MHKKINGIVTTSVIFGVLLILLNILTFVLPIPNINNSIKITSYILTEVVILIEYVLVITQLCLPDRNEKIAGLPIIHSGYIVLLLQTIFTAIIITLNTTIDVSKTLVIVVESLLIGVGIIQIAIAFLFKNKILDNSNSQSTTFMDTFRARLKAIVGINQNDNVQGILEDLYDMACGSDPITNEKTIDSEGELLSDLQELDEAVKNDSEEDIRLVVEKTKNTLIERNVLCKTGK